MSREKPTTRRTAGFVGSALGLAAALLIPAAPSLAARPCADSHSIHNGFLDNLATYAAALPHRIVEDASAAGAWAFPVCGAPNSVEPGYVPHGNPRVNGTATLEINNAKIEIHIDIGEIGVDRDYSAYHAHLYSTGSSYQTAAKGGSTICWASSSQYGSTQDDHTLHAENWGSGWYTSHIQEVDDAGGGEWFVMIHMWGGHFAVDSEGHLVEYDEPLHERLGDPANGVAANFYGLNTIKDSCNARGGRTLDNREKRADNSCLKNKTPENGLFADDYFLDQNGVAWLEANGDLSDDAIDHGYDKTTEYLFYSFGDEGVGFMYGGPEGGAGGFINSGLNGDRCDNWPAATWGDAHVHDAPEPTAGMQAVVALSVLIGLRARQRRTAPYPV